MLMLACRVTAEQTHRGLAISTQVDTGDNHGGWVATDSWVADASLDEGSVAEQIAQHGWRLTGPLREEADHTVAIIEPADWRVVVEYADATTKQAEHVHTARNGLIAAVPRDTLSVLDVAKSTGLTRHRIYQLQGYGKEPGFTF